MTDRTGRPPTLADIAARAGTTIPTVSKVINGRSDVSAATRQRIMDLVAETGYRRRTPTPGPRSGIRRGPERRLIDLVLAGVGGGWANQVLVGVESAAADAGLDLVVTVARTGDREDWVTRMLARESRGAVLALVDASAQQLAILDAAGVPVVLLDPVDQPPDDRTSIGTTNWSAGRDVAEHLLGLGHRRFGVLAESAKLLFSRARIDGFRSTVELAGGHVDQIVHWDSRSDKAEAAALLLDTAEPPTAIFADSDHLALSLLQVAADRGIAIPGDLSVVGFDDLPEAQWAGLTTVRQPIAEMGAAALRLLLRLADTGHSLPREELATTLVVRRTTAPPREAVSPAAD
ncbi:LacI family transcriptional regulator [Microlunatus endophyticus]|uniref:LacI family transcriptional regulator n=1 Tax=Microlunatus endophyticus TaxID=1716077 RepID=A0A917W6F5_9ACTN|nr:LacI family DNA-binding transcriptional regulator [Microlunatus endophyticus]GGL75534.1 LacI family transcriptional regulator [Microlunatus endophyticus]